MAVRLKTIELEFLKRKNSSKFLAFGTEEKGFGKDLKCKENAS